MNYFILHFFIYYIINLLLLAFNRNNIEKIMINGIRSIFKVCINNNNNIYIYLYKIFIMARISVLGIIYRYFSISY